MSIAPPPPDAAMPFLGAEFDLPPAATRGPGYVIASTPRCGSMLLCDLLHATGRFGVPTEYFHQQAMIAPLARRLGLTLPVGMGTYVPAVMRRRTTANGVFGAKMHFHQAWGVIEQPAFRRYLAGNRFVWLKRRDVMAQAISLAIAMRTNEWFRLRGSAAERDDAPQPVQIGPLFDALGRVRAENEFWGVFFRTNRIKPLELVYEDVLENPAAAIAAIGDLLGVDPGPPPSLEQTRFERQSSGRGDKWRHGLVSMLRVVEDRPKG